MTMQATNVYAARWVERAATDAALKLATGRYEVVVNGRRDAVWRVRPDGVVELARGNLGRVELLEVFGDGTSQLVAASPRSIRKIAASLCAVAAAASIVVGVVGAMVVSDAFAVLFGLMFVLFLLSFLLRWRSRVRPWVRARFGSDGDWADVPWKIEGAPTTGNQAIALAALADVRFRVLDDGTVEAVSRGKQVEVLVIDRLGAATVTETRPSKRFELDELRGPDVTWHHVYALDPTD